MSKSIGRDKNSGRREKVAVSTVSRGSLRAM